MGMLVRCVVVLGLCWSGRADGAGVAARREAAWQAHLRGEDAAAVVGLQAVIQTTAPAWSRHRRQVRRAAVQDLIRVVALGALAEDVVGTLLSLPAAERQDALLDLAAQAHDGGQPGLALAAARAAVEAAPEAILAPVGLALMALTHETQLRWDLACDVLLEWGERFGPGSPWAALSPGHAAAAALDREEREAALRRTATALHVEGRRLGYAEVMATRAEAPQGTDATGDPRSMERLIRANARALYACAQRARARRPELAGGLDLRFTLQPTGVMTDLQVLDDTLGDAEATRCVLDVLSGIPFEAHLGGDWIVRYPLRFPAAP